MRFKKLCWPMVVMGSALAAGSALGAQSGTTLDCGPNEHQACSSATPGGTPTCSCVSNDDASGGSATSAPAGGNPPSSGNSGSN